MFWSKWFKVAYPDATTIPSMSECTFTCKLCGKMHLGTQFRHGVAQVPATITTIKNGAGEFYFLCTDHEQAKAKSKGDKAEVPNQ